MHFLDFLSNVYVGSLSLSLVLSALIILVVCVIVGAIINKALRKLMQKSKLDNVLAGFIRSTVRVLLWILTAFIVAESLGIPSTSLIAAFSVVGLALSLSIQNTLSNLFSGLTVIVTKPFVAKDYIETPDASGTVESINLFYTVLLTPDNTLIYIPNSDITKSRISNCNKAARRRLDMSFRASYEDSTEKVKEALSTAIAKDERIFADPPPQIVIQSFDDSSVRYAVRVWVKTEDYWNVNFDLNESVRDSFEQSGVKMSYEHLNIHISGGQRKQASANNAE